MRFFKRQWMAVVSACLLGTMAGPPQHCLGQPAPVAGGSRAPVEPLKDRVAKADKVFVGTLVNKVEDGGWARAQLRVDEPIKGVKKGDLVKVQWLPKVAGYDAAEGQKGLALLSPKDGDSYWLRADTFDDAKLADEARKMTASAPASQPGETLFGEAVNGLRLGINGPKEAVPVGRQVKVTLALRNASDKTIQVLATFKHGEVVNYDVTAPGGTKLRYRGPVTDWDVTDYDKAVVELAPGKTFEQEVDLFGYDFSKPGKYLITAQYGWSIAKPPPGRKPAVRTRGPIWTGVVSSGTLEVTVGDAATQTGERGPTSQPAGAPDAAAAVKLAGEFLAAAKEKATRFQAFAVPPPANEWWLVEYHREGGLAVSPGPAVYVNKKTGEVTRQAPKGMPPRM